MIYIRCLDLPKLKLILSADDDAEGSLRYFIDGQRTPILYYMDESIALLATVHEAVRAAMDELPDLFEEYTHNELFDHIEQAVDSDGVKVEVENEDGDLVPQMIDVARTTDIFDLFHSTTPYDVTDEDGTVRTITPPTIPLRIA